MIRISDIAISVDIDDSVSQCLQIIDCLESQLETIKWFHIVILTEIAYKSSPESHEKLFYLLFFPGQDNMNMVVHYLKCDNDKFLELSAASGHKIH